MASTIQEGIKDENQTKILEITGIQRWDKKPFALGKTILSHWIQKKETTAEIRTSLKKVSILFTKTIMKTRYLKVENDWLNLVFFFLLENR
jgi:hypothetical protein